MSIVKLFKIPVMIVDIDMAVRPYSRPMKDFLFCYNGNTYSATLISSVNSDVQYHWVTLDGDNDLVQKLGDTIAFHVENGQLVPTYNYCRLSMVVEELRLTVNLLLDDNVAAQYLQATMNYDQMLTTLKRLAVELSNKLMIESNEEMVCAFKQHLQQIHNEIKRIEGMRSYMK